MPIYPKSEDFEESSGSGQVTSVNGQQGDVVVTSSSIGAQPSSPVLTSIASISMPNNSILLTNSSGNFTPTTCTPAATAWLSYTTVDQQKAHLALAEVASTGDYLDLDNLPVEFNPAPHNHLISEITGLNTALSSKMDSGQIIPASQISGLSSVATNGSYASLTDKPVIPDSTSDLVNDSGFITVSEAPVLSVAGKTGAISLDPNDIPGLSTVAITGIYNDLMGKPTTFPPSVHTHTIGDVSGLQIALDTKFNAPSGTTLQYVRGDGSLATTPVVPAVVSTFTNDAGYLTFITGSQVTTALGYTPYNGTTNPSNYITQAGARTAINLTTTGTSGAATYNSSTGVLNIPTYANSGGTVTSVTAGTGLSGGTITTTGTISMPNVGTPGTYNSVTTDAQGRVTAGTMRSFTSPTRSLNSAFQISTTRDVYVSYATDIACSATVLVGQSGTVVLEYADNSGMSTNVVTVQQSTASASGVLNMATIATATLTGVIPVGKYVRLRTVNNVGSPTFTYRTAQEVLL